MYMDRVATPGTGQAERVRRREAPASDTAPLPPLPPHSLSAATIAATHAAASISTAPLLHLPLSDAIGISHPHRCRPSLLPTPRRSPRPASIACIGHCQRRHLRRHHCQRERRLGRGRGRGLGYTAISNKVRVRVRVRERVATSQSGGPWRNRTSTTLRP